VKNDPLENEHTIHQQEKDLDYTPALNFVSFSAANSSELTCDRTKQAVDWQGNDLDNGEALPQMPRVPHCGPIVTNPRDRGLVRPQQDRRLRTNPRVSCSRQLVPPSSLDGSQTVPGDTSEEYLSQRSVYIEDPCGDLL
jgi:hypothetical protein